MNGNLTKEEKNSLIQELSIELDAKPDGSGKNLIVPKCPHCGKENGKYGIYIGQETEKKKPFMSHCFSCGYTTLTLEQLLNGIGRPDLIITSTTDLEAKLDTNLLFRLDENEDEIDDSLDIIELPDCYKRCYTNAYLKSRGFTFDDYDYFPCGTTRDLNFKFKNYIVFPIIDNNDVVGYVSRHIWPKDEIDSHNKAAKRNGEYMIMRYRNSTENDFVKLLYNYDAVIEDETDTVIIVEGIFDVIALTRKLELYDNHHVAVVATFGKKISQVQIYKLQSKGVKTVIVGYDGDAVDAIKKTSSTLNEYFDVFIADIPDATKDWEDLDFWEIYDIFSVGLKTPIQYKLTKIQGQ